MKNLFPIGRKFLYRGLEMLVIEHHVPLGNIWAPPGRPYIVCEYLTCLNELAKRYFDDSELPLLMALSDL